MERIAVGDIHRTVGEADRADIADEWIMVARDQIKLDATGNANVAKACELNFGVGLVGGMMELGDVAVHDHPIEIGKQRLEGIGVTSTTRSA